MSLGRSTRYFASRCASAGPEDRLWVPHEGGSMAPALRPGDLLLVEPLGARRARRGEIVVARRGDVLVAHRVVRLDGREVITRGDAGVVNDPPLADHYVVGRVILVDRCGRRFAPAGPSLWGHVRRWMRKVELRVRAGAGVGRLRACGAGLFPSGRPVEGAVPRDVVRGVVRQAAGQSGVRGGPRPEVTAQGTRTLD